MMVCTTIVRGNQLIDVEVCAEFMPADEYLNTPKGWVADFCAVDRYGYKYVLDNQQHDEIEKTLNDWGAKNDNHG